MRVCSVVTPRIRAQSDPNGCLVRTLQDSEMGRFPQEAHPKGLMLLAQGPHGASISTLPIEGITKCADQAHRGVLAMYKRIVSWVCAVWVWVMGSGNLDFSYQKFGFVIPGTGYLPRRESVDSAIMKIFKTSDALTRRSPTLGSSCQ